MAPRRAEVESARKRRGPNPDPASSRDEPVSFANAIRSGSDYAQEFRYRHSSGEWRWMDGRGRVYFERQYVWKMETGRVAPSLGALSHFAKRLGTTIADLVRGA